MIERLARKLADQKYHVDYRNHQFKDGSDQGWIKTKALVAFDCDDARQRFLNWREKINKRRSQDGTPGVIGEIVRIQGPNGLCK